MRSEQMELQGRKYVLFWPDRPDCYSAEYERIIGEAGSGFLPLLVRGSDGVAAVDVTGLRAGTEKQEWNRIEGMRILEAAGELERRGVCVVYQAEHFYVKDDGHPVMIALPYIQKSEGTPTELNRRLGLMAAAEEKEAFIGQLIEQIEPKENGIGKVMESETVSAPAGVKAPQVHVELDVMEAIRRSVMNQTQDTEEIRIPAVQTAEEAAPPIPEVIAQAEIRREPVSFREPEPAPQIDFESSQAIANLAIKFQQNDPNSFKEASVTEAPAAPERPPIPDSEVLKMAENEKEEPKKEFDLLNGPFGRADGKKTGKKEVKKDEEKRGKGLIGGIFKIKPLPEFGQRDEKTEEAASDEEPTLYLSKIKRRDKKSIRISKEGVVYIGRTAAFADVVINNMSVSEKHAAIKYDHGTYWLTDVGSTNGTLVDGKPITPGTDVVIREMSAISFGNAQFYAVFDSEKE